jgi:hypothetical protein
MAAVTSKPDTPPPAARPPAGLPEPAPHAAQIPRALLLVLCLLVGLAVGTVGSFLHRAGFGGADGGAGFPDGLLLSLGALAGLLLGLGELTRPAPAPDSPYPGRLAALGAAAVGWVVAVIWLTYLGSPANGLSTKGDVVLANDWRSMTYLIAGMALATAFLYKAWIATLDVRLSRARESGR